MVADNANSVSLKKGRFTLSRTTAAKKPTGAMVCKLCAGTEFTDTTGGFTVEKNGAWFGIEKTPAFECTRCKQLNFDEHIAKRLTQKAVGIMSTSSSKFFVCQFEDMKKKDPFKDDDTDWY